MAREQLKTLTEPMYYILLALTRANHGYGIMQMIDGLTEGRVAVGAGTMYSLLGRFEKEKIICQIEEVGRRKIYRLTEKGEALLKEEYCRIHQLAKDGSRFFDSQGDLLPPPEDDGFGGAGISMPLEEAEGDVSEDAVAQEEGRQGSEVPGAGREPADSPDKERRERRFGFGGAKKGLVLPT